MSCRGVACQHIMINGVFPVLPFSCASDGTSKNFVLSKINEQIKKRSWPSI